MQLIAVPAFRLVGDKIFLNIFTFCAGHVNSDDSKRLKTL